jgi:hypothetical protein
VYRMVPVMKARPKDGYQSGNTKKLPLPGGISRALSGASMRTDVQTSLISKPDR